MALILKRLLILSGFFIPLTSAVVGSLWAPLAQRLLLRRATAASTTAPSTSSAAAETGSSSSLPLVPEPATVSIRAYLAKADQRAFGECCSATHPCEREEIRCRVAFAKMIGRALPSHRETGRWVWRMRRRWVKGWCCMMAGICCGGFLAGGGFYAMLGAWAGLYAFRFSETCQVGSPCSTIGYVLEPVGQAPDYGSFDEVDVTVIIHGGRGSHGEPGEIPDFDEVMFDFRHPLHGHVLKDVRTLGRLQERAARAAAARGHHDSLVVYADKECRFSLRSRSTTFRDSPEDFELIRLQGGLDDKYCEVDENTENLERQRLLEPENSVDSEEAERTRAAREGPLFSDSPRPRRWTGAWKKLTKCRWAGARGRPCFVGVAEYLKRFREICCGTPTRSPGDLVGKCDGGVGVVVYMSYYEDQNRLELV